MTIHILPERQAQDFTERLANLEMGYAWGGSRRVTVAWKPKAVYGADLGAENTYKVPVVWLDEPPVYLARGGTGHVALRPRIEQVAAQRLVIVEANRRDDNGPLEPGEYRIIFDSEDE